LLFARSPACRNSNARPDAVESFVNQPVLFLKSTFTASWIDHAPLLPRPAHVISRMMLLVHRGLRVQWAGALGLFQDRCRLPLASSIRSPPAQLPLSGGVAHDQVSRRSKRPLASLTCCNGKHPTLRRRTAKEPTSMSISEFSPLAVPSRARTLDHQNPPPQVGIVGLLLWLNRTSCGANGGIEAHSHSGAEATRRHPCSGLPHTPVVSEVVIVRNPAWKVPRPPGRGTGVVEVSSSSP